MVRKGLSKKVRLKQAPIGGKGQGGSLGRVFPAEEPARAEVLRVQSSQEASRAGVG